MNWACFWTGLWQTVVMIVGLIAYVVTATFVGIGLVLLVERIWGTHAAGLKILAVFVWIILAISLGTAFGYSLTCGG